MWKMREPQRFKFIELRNLHNDVWFYEIECERKRTLSWFSIFFFFYFFPTQRECVVVLGLRKRKSSGKKKEEKKIEKNELILIFRVNTFSLEFFFFFRHSLRYDSVYQTLFLSFWSWSEGAFFLLSVALFGWRRMIGRMFKWFMSFMFRCYFIK